MNALTQTLSANYVFLILGMALVTYAIRAAVFVLGERLAFPPLVRTALSFVPVTVLTAIIVPMTVSPHGGGAELTWRNSQLVAAVVAVRIITFAIIRCTHVIVGGARKWMIII